LKERWKGKEDEEEDVGELLDDFEENEKLRKLWNVGALDSAVWRTRCGSTR